MGRPNPKAIDLLFHHLIQPAMLELDPQVIMSDSIPTIPAVTEESIEDWVGSRNIQLGFSYFKSQAIIDPRSQGNAIKAFCQGTMPQPYRLQVDFGPQGVIEADCSCPVGGGGHCKHVGALLVTWLHRPETFRVAPELDAALEQRSKSELIVLIKKMLQLQPDLEMLLEAALPGEDRRGAPVNPENYRRQVTAAFRRAGNDWYAMRGVPNDIGITLSAAHGFLALADYGNASIVYQAVAQGIIEHYEMVQDDEGELCATVDRCVEGLADCLAGIGPNSDGRADILQTLFDVYIFNMDYGGGDSDLDAKDTFLEHATSEEKSALAGRIRAAMPEGTSWSDDYRRRVLGSFLLDLEQADSDDEAFLEICRKSGLLAQMSNRLLILGRSEEALAEAERASDYDILAMAEVFLQHGCSQLIEPLLAKRLETDNNHRLLDWLKERHKERGELVEALALARRKLEPRPRITDYLEVRELSQGIGVWQELRPQLLKRWNTDGEYGLLTEIHLEESEIDLALKSVKQTKFAYALGGNQLVRVAQAAAATHPQDAMDIYRQQAERLIDARGRENYQQACNHLLKVRELYLHLSRESEWTDFIAQLREEHRRLPALKEELGNAGL